MHVRINYKKEGVRFIYYVEEVVVRERLRAVEIIAIEGKTLINFDAIRSIDIEYDEEGEKAECQENKN